MNGRGFVIAIVFALFIRPVATGHAQEGINRIGFLSQCSSSFDQEAFARGLRELGYIEGQNIVVLWRHFPGETTRLRPAADALVGSKVDVIVTCSTAATRAAFAATRDIPIVFTGIADPVASGVATSLARAGANATGVSVLVPELYPKRLDLLQQMVPGMRRVVFIVNLSSPGSALALRPLEAAARTLSIRLEVHNTRNADEVESALRTLSRASVDGVLVGGDTVVFSQREKIAQAVISAHLPAVYPWRQFHEYGALMSYGPDPNEIMRRAARYVDKIFKGARPQDLPIEQVSKIDLVIDLRVAHKMKMDVPQELLYRADEVLR